MLYTRQKSKLRCYHTADLLLCAPWMASHSRSAIIKWMTISKPLEKNVLIHRDQHRVNTLLSLCLYSFEVHCPLLCSLVRYFFSHLLKPSRKIRQASCASFSLFYTWKLFLLTVGDFSPGRLVSITNGQTETTLREEFALAICLSLIEHAETSFKELVRRKYIFLLIGTGRVLWKNYRSICIRKHCLLSVGVFLTCFCTICFPE